MQEKLECKIDKLLDNFQSFLYILDLARLPKREEIYATYFIRVLFEVFDDRVNDQQYSFNKDFITVNNADFYASIIDIIRKRLFGNFNTEKVCYLLIRFAIFADKTISVKFLKQQI